MFLKEKLKLIFKKLKVSCLIYYTKLIYGRKVRKLLKTKPRKRLSKTQKNKIRSYFAFFGHRNVSIKWHEFVYASNDHFSKKYIPEDLYYTKIEPALNRLELFPALVDKNLFSIFFKDVDHPRSILKNQNGFNFDSEGRLISDRQAIEICLSEKEFIIKPSIESGGGKGVLFHKNNLGKLDSEKNRLELILEEYNKDYIIQEFISQNEQMKKLNSSSINTIRVMSFLRKNEVIIVSAVIRIGRNGQYVDNSSAGGISCGIKSNGKLKTYGFDSVGNKFTKTDSGVVLGNFEIPCFEAILETAIALHKITPNFKLISWDLAISDKNQIILIEYNIKWQEINFHQINNGPLFREYADEILHETINFRN